MAETVTIGSTVHQAVWVRDASGTPVLVEFFQKEGFSMPVAEVAPEVADFLLSLGRQPGEYVAVKSPVASPPAEADPLAEDGPPAAAPKRTRRRKAEVEGDTDGNDS